MLDDQGVAERRITASSSGGDAGVSAGSDPWRGPRRSASRRVRCTGSIDAPGPPDRAMPPLTWQRTVPSRHQSCRQRPRAEELLEQSHQRAGGHKDRSIASPDRSDARSAARTVRGHGSHRPGRGLRRARNRARPRPSIRASASRASSRPPNSSNRQSSMRSAWAEKTAKLTPPGSTVAPSGCGRPGSRRSTCRFTSCTSARPTPAHPMAAARRSRYQDCGTFVGG